MRLEDGNPRATSSSRYRAWLIKFGRWLRQPVDFWRAMEVMGLWTAAGVGLLAIHYSTRDAGEQVKAMREQLHAMSGQLDEMQQEGRAWLGPVGAHLVNKNPEEPLKISLAYRNFGKQPAAFVRNRTGAALLTMKSGEEIEQLPGWKDPKVFNPRSLCQTESSSITVYPSETYTSIEGGVTKQTPAKEPTGAETLVSTVVDEIVREQALYVFFGCFTYFSAGKAEYTTFCIMLDPRTSNNSHDLSMWQFPFCPYGNDNGEDKADRG
jgi:hypothetical protein